MKRKIKDEISSVIGFIVVILVGFLAFYFMDAAYKMVG